MCKYAGYSWIKLDAFKSFEIRCGEPWKRWSNLLSRNAAFASMSSQKSRAFYAALMHLERV